eukprot:scaffold8583_cov62-Phaeocystis_antarctica.AAC.1
MSNWNCITPQRTFNIVIDPRSLARVRSSHWHSNSCVSSKRVSTGTGDTDCINHHSYSTREHGGTVGSTLAAEAQAISATCAASRTPARAIASRGEGRGARPHAQRMSSLLAADKELAFCRVERGACDAGRGARARRREGHGVEAASGLHGGRARLKAGGPKGTRGAHVEHLLHGCDLGRVEGQRLVERRRLLPESKGGHAMRGEVRAGRRQGVGAAVAQVACTGKARL